MPSCDHPSALRRSPMRRPRAFNDSSTSEPRTSADYIATDHSTHLARRLLWDERFGAGVRIEQMENGMESTIRLTRGQDELVALTVEDRGASMIG